MGGWRGVTGARSHLPQPTTRTRPRRLTPRGGLARSRARGRRRHGRPPSGIIEEDHDRGGHMNPTLTPPDSSNPARVRIEGTLDAVRASDATFTLKLDDGSELPGRLVRGSVAGLGRVL